MRRAAILPFFLVLLSVASLARQPTCDLLFAGGRVVDGTGAAWFRADVCVAGDRITAVGQLTAANASRRIDATDLVIAPGFIDMLGQSEYWALRDSRVASKVMQGITTELTGEASFSSAAHRGARRLHPFAVLFDREGVPGWDNLGGYLRVLDRQPATINLGTFISAGGIRDAVIGRDDRAATPEELREMEAQVAEAMEAGAFGVSTSLQYVPDRFARTDELVALAAVAGRYGGSYITHQRSEADEIDASLDEIFRIARKPVCRRQFTTSRRPTSRTGAAWPRCCSASSALRPTAWTSPPTSIRTPQAAIRWMRACRSGRAKADARPWWRD
ncbi:MAG: hypothetical protein R2712_12205 [Vicinamibacterales bacterium]